MTSTSSSDGVAERRPGLQGQTVVVVGGSAGIGLATARRARAEGAEVILAARRPDRLEAAVTEVGAVRGAAFDATDPEELLAFFDSLAEPIDHVMVTAGAPGYGPLLELTPDAARTALSEHLLQAIVVAQASARRVRPGGTLVFMGGTGAKRPAIGIGAVAAVTAALPALIANLALELAPVRVNLIAAGFVDTPLSASLLGGDLDARRQELRDTLPIARVVGPEDVAALAVHLMANTALTGATFDIDGGQQLVG
jgi:NAD(P)-dependent dehydrogenase (short-subunit alcohol dehydrogenase family)